MANLGQNGINLIIVSQMTAQFKQMFSDRCGFMNRKKANATVFIVIKLAKKLFYD